MPLTGAQINLCVDDPQVLAGFCAGLGPTVRFRFPAAGSPHVVEMAVADVTPGLPDRQAVEALTPLVGSKGPPQAEIEPWCGAAAAGQAARVAAGAAALSEPARVDARLAAPWIAGPEGNRIKLVSPLPAGAA